MIDAFFLTKWFFYAVRWFYDIFNNSYLLTIFMITFLLRLVQVFPDYKSRKSQQKMAALNPEIEILKKQYANNPQQLQQAQGKLMKERGVNMWSGCLPMLMTMPIFFCFLAAFRHWGYEQTVKLTYESLTNPTQASETLDSFQFLWITNIWQPDSGLAPVVPASKNIKSYAKSLHKLALFSEGYTTLDGVYVSGEELWQTFVEHGLAEGELGTDSAKFLPNEESYSAYDETVKPLLEKYEGFNNGWFILPILAAAFQFLGAVLSQRYTQRVNPSAGSQQGGKLMLYAFPLMSIFFCLSSTSAFALYWVLSSIFQIITTLIMGKLLSGGNGAIIDMPADKVRSRGR